MKESNTFEQLSRNLSNFHCIPTPVQLLHLLYVPPSLKVSIRTVIEKKLNLVPEIEVKYVPHLDDTIALYECFVFAVSCYIYIGLCNFTDGMGCWERKFSNPVCFECISERLLCQVDVSSGGSCNTFCRNYYTFNMIGVEAVGICSGRSDKADCPCLLPDYKACFCIVMAFHPAV